MRAIPGRLSCRLRQADVRPHHRLYGCDPRPGRRPPRRAPGPPNQPFERPLGGQGPRRTRRKTPAVVRYHRGVRRPADTSRIEREIPRALLVQSSLARRHQPAEQRNEHLAKLAEAYPERSPGRNELAGRMDERKFGPERRDAARFLGREPLLCRRLFRHVFRGGRNEAGRAGRGNGELATPEIPWCIAHLPSTARS